MARKLFAFGIFTMAIACGVFGYQTLTYYFYGNWPAVSSQFVFGELFGDFPMLKWQWGSALLETIGKLPFSAVAVVVSYALLLVSDLLRGEGKRQASQ